MYDRLFLYDSSTNFIEEVTDVIVIKMGSAAQVAQYLSVGDYYFNTNSNKLYIVTGKANETTIDYQHEVSPKTKCLYYCDGIMYKWNGTSFVFAEKEYNDSIRPISFTKHGYLKSQDGDFVNSERFDCSDTIFVNVGDIINYSGTCASPGACICGYTSNGNSMVFDRVLLPLGEYRNQIVIVPSGIDAISVCGRNSNVGEGFYVSCSITSPYNYAENYNIRRGITKITGLGRMSTRNSGVSKVGDIYINDSNSKLYICTNYVGQYNFTQREYGIAEDGNIFIYNNALYVFTNNSLVRHEILKSNPLYGKKLYVIGDSIPHGQSMPVPSGATQCSHPYPDIIASRFGMQLKNYAIGGSTMAISPLVLGGTERQYGGTVTSWSADRKDTEKYYILLTGSYSTSGVGNYGGVVYYYDGSSWVTSGISARTPLIGRYDIMDNDADIILVAAGTNDFQYNWTSIGTIEDNTPNTFYGAVKLLCEGLLAKYLGKPIIFATPIKRCQTQTTSSDITIHNGGNYGTIDSENYYGKTLKEYGEIIKEVCARYSIPVIDLYAESNLNPQLDSQTMLFDVYKTHPTQLGHDVLSRVVAGKVNSFYGVQ
jgi:hypothetical protein